MLQPAVYAVDMLLLRRRPRLDGDWVEYRGRQRVGLALQRSWRIQWMPRYSICGSER